MDPNTKEDLLKLKDSLTRELDYQGYLIKSYEAEVERVEPLSDEFERIVRGIFEAKDKIKDLAPKITEVKFNIAELEGKY